MLFGIRHSKVFEDVQEELTANERATADKRHNDGVSRDVLQKPSQEQVSRRDVFCSITTIRYTGSFLLNT